MAHTPTDFTTGQYANLPPIHQTILSIEDDIASEISILENTTCTGTPKAIKRCEYSAQKSMFERNKQRKHKQQAIGLLLYWWVVAVSLTSK